MGSAFWVTNTADTHSEYVTLIVFLRQQWLRQRIPVLRHMYTVHLVNVTPTYITTITTTLYLANKKPDDSTLLALGRVRERFITVTP
jgi:hypothetical protein